MERGIMFRTSLLSVTVLVLALLPSVCVFASWQTDGNPICTAAGDQYPPTIASDGAGGAIITWYDLRNGNYDIYAQRVDASGAVQWTTDGVAICTATGTQSYATITSDGAGGAIISWQDNRNGTWDMYAQRVNASGAVQWTVDGIAICTETGDQYNSTIVSDGAGGAIITWEDFRSGNYDIYAQRLDASGAAQWTTNGVALCKATNQQYSPMIISDGASGAIVTWLDRRSGTNYDIYAQSVNASGAVQWTANGVALCTAGGDQTASTIVSDGAGGAIVTWTDYRSGSNNDIYAQRVNASGAVQWTANGVAISTATGEQRYSTIASDGSGGAIMTWHDNRDGTYHIYAQRVNASGAVQWTADGIAICMAAGGQNYPMIMSDGGGGAIITWNDGRDMISADIYAQRVNASGVVQWTADGVPISTGADNQQYPQMVSDGAGGAIVTWQDYRSDWDVYALRVDANGHPVVATLLQDYAATFSGDQIAITWALSEIDEGIEFSVERATASDGAFIELPTSAMRRDRLSFTFTDSNWQPNMSYWYRVEYQIGSERKVLFEAGPIKTPSVPVTLFQNSPNPFNPSTEIRYYLPERCSVALEIYNVNGALVVRLIDGYRDKGSHTVSWDGRDRDGRQVNSGMYFYRLKAGKAEISKKMVLAR